MMKKSATNRAAPRAPKAEYRVPKKGPKKVPAAMSRGRLGIGVTTMASPIIPAVTAEQMLKVDRLAVKKYRLGILQMMEQRIYSKPLSFSAVASPIMSLQMFL
jgi:hypothetical protein